MTATSRSPTTVVVINQYTVRAARPDMAVVGQAAVVRPGGGWRLWAEPPL